MTVWFWIKVATAFYLRVNVRMGKYKIWALYAIISLPIVENALYAELEAYQLTMRPTDFSFSFISKPNFEYLREQFSI